ncbi:MAG: hypothetical protein PHT62_09520 [Desulfotomaculaceae bacterium]|nr:hypothetical protein [Desulfotomaculaceae bacterium]
MRKKNNLTVVFIDDVLQWGWSITDLASCLTKIDASTLGCVWTMEQWVPILESRWPICLMLATDDDNIVGYFLSFALMDRTFQTAMNGSLKEQDINISNIIPMNSSGDYNLYGDTFAIMPDFRTVGSLLLLLGAFINELIRLAQQGVYMKKSCTKVISDSGLSIASLLSMKPVCNHSSGGTIYFGTFHPLGGIYKKNSQLVELYQDHFIHRYISNEHHDR